MVLRPAGRCSAASRVELLDPVPPEDLTRAMLHGADESCSRLDISHSSVLTLARIWLTVETGEIGPKDAAADWALERLRPVHRAVLARARAIYYLGDEDEAVQDDLRPRVDARRPRRKDPAVCSSRSFLISCSSAPLPCWPSVSTIAGRSLQPPVSGKRPCRDRRR